MCLVLVDLLFVPACVSVSLLLLSFAPHPFAKQRLLMLCKRKKEAICLPFSAPSLFR